MTLPFWQAVSVPSPLHRSGAGRVVMQMEYLVILAYMLSIILFAILSLKNKRD